MVTGYSAFKSNRIAFIFVCFQIVAGLPAVSQVNQWTNTTSANWQDPYWSLGVLPDSSQTVEIVNPGYKAVGIRSSTVEDPPESLTIGSLMVAGPVNSANTLLLDYAGASTPLRVLNGATVGNNGTIENLHSGLAIEQGALSITNGKVIQNYGFVTVSNGAIYLDGFYSDTNGDVTAENIYLGVADSGTFRHHGGVVLTGSLICGYGSTNQGIYSFDDGWLITTNLQVGTLNAFCHFLQNGGTNSTDRLAVSAGYNTPPEYSLNGGFLGSGLTRVDGTTFEQSGGTHLATNGLFIAGFPGAPDEFVFARYNLSGGVLQAPSIDVSDYGSFAQSNGTTQVSGAVHFETVSAVQRTASYLAGGNVFCNDITHGGVGADFVQTEGALVVSNLFSFGGLSTNPPLDLATYDFSGGTLDASNMDFQARVHLGGAETKRISNPGYFKLAGILAATNSDESLGKFILAGDSTLDLAGNSSRLAFSNSSGETWTNGAKLIITNWNGSANGGDSDQLFFGSTASGLTGAQLNQIRFANPAGFPPGTTRAKILDTGEVVPASNASETVALTSPKSQNGALEFKVQSAVPGNSYAVEVSTNLTEWQVLTNVTPTNATFQITAPTANAPHAFYRMSE